MSRKINERRSVCRINGMIVSAGVLQNVGTIVCEIHGQGDQTYLVNSDQQLLILDEYGQLHGMREQMKEQFSAFKSLAEEIILLEQQRSQSQERVDLFQFQINEINSAHIEINEESGLRENVNRLSNAAELKQAATQAIQAFSGDENDNRWSVENLFREGGALLGQLQDMDPSTKPLNQLAEGTLFNIEDIVRRLRDYSNSVEVNPEELELLEARMGLLNEMKRKYGNTLEEVVSYKDKLALQLEELDTSEQKIQDLREIQIEQKRLLGKTALALSVKRKKFSKPLETKVESYLKGVGMDNAKFKVRINNRKDEDGLLISACGNTDSYIYGPDGIDDVQMLFSTNKNHPPLPLSQVASGGELSRIMLAIFVTVNSSDTNSTLVFDEIDSGVGGRTGTIIGQKLRDLSNQRQVICVTHLPQLASFAKNHWSITKKESNHKVVVAAHLLKGDEIIKELGLMIASGDKTSGTAAQAMIDQAKS
ncbi:MAG: hypothetical protein CL880_04610 [Dehalococcoidia bacterium]|nr:hypothetical protein [Dehalococcoidia bacterium]